MWVGPEGKEVKIPGLLLLITTEAGLQHLLNIVWRFGVEKRL